MDISAGVNAYIEDNQDQIITFLREFINHRSINVDRALPEEAGDEKVCQDWLRQEMENMGIFDRIDHWEIEKGRPNLAGVIGDPETSEKSIMFNGHVDVVPVTRKQYQDWRYGSPWEATFIDGRVYGRGATDMKGGITAMLWAVKALSDLGVKINGHLILAFNTAEESSNFDIGSRSVINRGYRPQLVINAEPTNLIICPATKGLFSFKVTVKGKSAHVAHNNLVLYPSHYGTDMPGVNAINKARKVLDAFDDLNQQWGLHRKHPVTPPGGMNLCLVSMKGGEYLSSIPDSCELIYLVWFNPDLNSNVVMAEIRDTLENVINSDYWFKDHPPALEMPYLEADKNIYEPIDIKTDDKACQALGDAFELVMKKPARFECFPAVCDANVFYEAGIPALIMGPGDLSMGAHGSNEYVPVEQVINASKIYANMLINWLGTK